MAKAKWLGRFAAGTAREVAQWIVTWGLTAAAPVVTVGIGLLEGFPWFWIWIGSLAAFAFAATGLLRFDAWLSNRRVRDKVALETVLLARSADHPDGIVVGFRFNSSASFPIEFRLKSIKTRIGDRVPAKTTFAGATQFIVPPNGQGWFWDNVITVSDPPKGGSIEGFLEFDAEYGRPGNLMCPFHGKKQVIVGFNDEGIFSGGNWHEAT